MTERLVADAPADQNSIMWDNPSSAGLLKVTSDAQNRVLDGPTVFGQYVYINTKRVTDLDTRKALNYAYNKQAILQIIGGEKAGTIATTITSPVTPGYKKFDAYPAPAAGDPAKAKELLKGKDLSTPLNYCYRAGSDVRVKTAAASKEASRLLVSRSTLRFSTRPTTTRRSVSRPPTVTSSRVVGVRTSRTATRFSASS